MDRDDRYARLPSDRAKTQADEECPCDDAHRRRFDAQSRRERPPDASRARTGSARPSNALRAGAPAANAQYRCGDAEADQILRANNAARVSFRAPAVVLPRWECAHAAECGPLFRGESTQA